MSKRYLEIKGVKRDDTTGKRYLDVSSEAAEALGITVLVPLVVVKGEPNSATSSVATATSAATMPTATDMRDLISEADAILADSSDSSTERRELASNSMKASSSDNVAGVRSSWLVTASIAAIAIVFVSFIVWLLMGRF